MKPEIQRIFTKLAEERVKLSTKKVELSSLQDMKKKSNDLISWFSSESSSPITSFTLFNISVAVIYITIN